NFFVTSKAKSHQHPGSIAASVPKKWEITVLCIFASAVPAAESGSRSAPFALRFAHALCVAKMQLRRRRHLPATFNTVLLLRLAKAAYAYCVCRCNCGQGSTRQGTPVTDA